MLLENIQFTHLHTHTPRGSLLDGYMRIPKAIELAQEWGMDSIGISDHGSMAAHKEFYDQCKEAGIHPVLGMEAYITPKKEYRKKDFDTVMFDSVLGEDDKEIFSFEIVTKEEFDNSNNLSTTENISPKSYQDKILRSQKLFLIEEVKKTFSEDDKMPGIRALGAMAEALKESYASKDIIVAIRGDATLKNYFSWHPRIGHLLLIAKNNEGYRNMLKLNTIGQFEGFYKKPRIDYEDIKKYGKGIVATTACLGSIPSQLILRGHLEEAKKHILMLKDCFEELYLEIQPSRQTDQHVVNKQLIEWSKELEIPLIATSDVHMLAHSELKIHEALSNIGASNVKNGDDNDISVYDTAYFMHPKEMLEYGIPREALQNAYDLSHSCNVTALDDREWKFPVYEIPEGYTFDTYLESLAVEGLFSFMLDEDIDYNLYQERLHYELEIIRNKSLSAYFIIVWDYVNFARKEDILIGAGRGSGAGSLVLFCLGITGLDPIKYDLLFEREQTCAR